MRHRSFLAVALIVLFSLTVVSVSSAQQQVPVGGSVTVTVTSGTSCTVNGQSFPVPDGIFIIPVTQPGTISYNCADGSTGSIVGVEPTMVPTLDCQAQGTCPPTQTPVFGGTPPPAPLGSLCTAFNDVNIRANPAADAQIVGRLAGLQPYGYYENQGGWLRIDSGWVSSTVVTLGDCSNLTPLPPDPNEVNVEAYESCMPVYESLVDQGASEMLLTAYSKRENACGYAGYLAASLSQEPVEDLNPAISTCTDPLVLPTFVDIWGDLTPATRENLGALFQQRGEQGACALISNFVVDQSLEGLETDFPLESALEIIGNVCDIHQSSASVVAAAWAAAAAGIELQDLLVGEPCTVVETITLLGELDSDEQALYNRLSDNECAGLTADGALQLLTYAVGSGGDIQAMLDNPDLCSQIGEDGVYSIPVDDFTEEEAEQIEIIAGGLTCEDNPTIRTMLVMFLWNKSVSENLTDLQLASLLTAPDACTVVRAYLDTGALPPPPVDGGNVNLPQPDPNFVETSLNSVTVSVPELSGPDGFMNLLGLSSSPDSVMDATAVFLVRYPGLDTVELGFLHRGQIIVQSLIPGSDIQHVALDQRGHQLIAVGTDGDGYAVFSVDFTPQFEATSETVTTQEPKNILNTVDLDYFINRGLLPGSGSFSVESAPLAYGRQNGELVVTLRNGSTTQLYLFARSGDNPLTPLAAVEAYSPAYSPTPQGDWLAYVTGEVGSRQIAMIDLETNRSQSLLHQQQGLVDCFEPVFVPEMPARLMFTCENAGERSLHVYDEYGIFYPLEFSVTETLQGDAIDFSQIRNVAPGPELDYIAFDDGQRMYFAHITPPADAAGSYVVDEIHTLISNPGYQVSAMRWATLSDTVSDTALETGGEA